MTPIKMIMVRGSQVYTLDHANLLDLKCIAVDEKQARWLAWSLARAHGVKACEINESRANGVGDEITTLG